MNNIVTGIAVGTIVFVLGQYFLKLVLEPAVELRRAIATVAAALTEHANLYGNAGAMGEELSVPGREAAKDVRRLAAHLRSLDSVVAGHGAMRCILGLPPRNDLIEATSELIGLSNSFPGVPVDPGQGHINIKTAKTIERLLRIHGERQN